MNDNFKTRARQHQTKFRTEVLKVGYDSYVTWLKQTDGERGLNFYNGFGIFKSVKSRYPEYKQGLYSDILRSEHIPFNFFVPFDNDKLFRKNVLNMFLGDSIKTVDAIKIEYAPSPAKKYLNDRTSFDAYIEYTHSNGKKGIIGIEVKYTEKEYPLKAGSKEEKDISDQSSTYFSATNDCGIYKPTSKKLLITDRFRQVWRNHLLGQKILLVDNKKFKHFTSLILFPKDNSHFIETSKGYISLLNENKINFLPVTYEDFLLWCYYHCPNNNFKNWINYLTKRYIVK